MIGQSRFEDGLANPVNAGLKAQSALTPFSQTYYPHARIVPNGNRAARRRFEVQMLSSQPISSAVTNRRLLFILTAISFLLLALPVRAAAGGSISGAISDPTGAFVGGTTLTLINIAQQTIYRAVSNRQGLYSFLDLPVGQYDLTMSANGFITQKKTNLTVDTDSAIRVDATLAIGARADTVTVTSDTGAQGRYDRRPGQARPDLLLHRLSGNANDRGRVHGQYIRSYFSPARRRLSRSLHAAERTHRKRERTVSGIFADTGAWLYCQLG